MIYEDVITELAKSANPSDAQFLQRFFKTGPGQYGEGDIFIGVRMSPVRQVAKKYKDLNLSEVQKLLNSKVHEHRMCGLIILTLKYPKVSEVSKQEIYGFYLKNAKK